MSDLAATNCGCGCSDGGCNSILWIILLLFCCNGSGSCSGGGSSCGGCGDSLWIIILLLCCCNGSGSGIGCF